MDLGSCKFYGAVKSKKPDAASAVDGNDDGGEVSVFVWEGAERRRDGQTCIKRLKVRNEVILILGHRALCECPSTKGAERTKAQHFYFLPI